MQFPKWLSMRWSLRGSFKKAKMGLEALQKKLQLEVISKKVNIWHVDPCLYVLCNLYTGWHNQLGPLLMDKINHLFLGIRLVFVHRLMTGVCEDILLSNIRLKNSSYTEFRLWLSFFSYRGLSILKIGCDIIITTKLHFSVTPPSTTAPCNDLMH